MEKLPTNTSEAIRFSGGVPRVLRNIEEEISVVQQNLARAADLILFYETELSKIARTEILSVEKNGFVENFGFIINVAKQAIKQGKKM
jgi:hypothetical protein